MGSDKGLGKERKPYHLYRMCGIQIPSYQELELKSTIHPSALDGCTTAVPADETCHLI